MRILERLLSELKDTSIKNLPFGYQIQKHSSKLKTINFQLSVKKIIWPAREGELIEHPEALPINFDYSLSYPGTASTKSMVLFTNDQKGIFIGGKPTEEYAKIKIRKIKSNKVKITYESREHNLIFIPFKNNNWVQAIKIYKKHYKIHDKQKNSETNSKPKFMLQIGVNPPNQKAPIRDFLDLKNPIDYFASKIGTNHIIHFYGTDGAGFDRMDPRFEMDPKLGGNRSMRKLLKYIKQKGFLTSVHYNPRLADYDWIRNNPKYKLAIIKNEKNYPICEIYNGHPLYIMNPNNSLWFEKCMSVVKNLRKIGFDYIQTDQFSYQRCFYLTDKPFIRGYKQLVKELERLGINYWLEGVNDQFHPNGISYSQILVRIISRLWDDYELRRGYPFGKSFPKFYTSIYPNDNYAYQVLKEDRDCKKIKDNLRIAKQVKAMVYDLQMDFFNKDYVVLLKKVVNMILKHG